MTFFGLCDNWDHEYSSVVIIGSTFDRVLKGILEFCKKNNEQPEDFCYNGIGKNGVITFDMSDYYPEDICVNLSKLLPDAIVYADMAWDYHGVCAMKNGKRYDEFAAKFINNTPQMPSDDSEDGWDIDVKITDNVTGYSFVTGEGMCEKEDLRVFKKIIKKHTPNN